MVDPVLTIAIPTYNREHYIDRQIDWAIHSIAGRWDRVELIVSDNGSQDGTPEVCERWRQQTNGQLRVFRQPRNLGLTLNALHCIQQARGRYIWLVSDDDEIEHHTFEWLLATVSGKSEEGFSFIHLNGLMKDKQGRVIIESVYNFRQDRQEKPGTYLFQECLRQSITSIGLTCSIYHAETARLAAQYWPGVRNNLAFPVFLAGFCAAHGEMVVRAEPSVAYIDGATSFRSIWPVVDFYLLPEVYVKLLEVGYQKEFIRSRILSNLNFIRFIIKFPVQFIKSIPLYLKALNISKGL